MVRPLSLSTIRASRPSFAAAIVLSSVQEFRERDIALQTHATPRAGRSRGPAHDAAVTIRAQQSGAVSRDAHEVQRGPWAMAAIASFPLCMSQTSDGSLFIGGHESRSREAER